MDQEWAGSDLEWDDLNFHLYSFAGGGGGGGGGSEEPDEWDLYSALDEPEPPFWVQRVSPREHPEASERRRYAGVILSPDAFDVLPTEQQEQIEETVAIRNLLSPQELVLERACVFWGRVGGSVAEGTLEKRCVSVRRSDVLLVIDADEGIQARWCTDTWACGGAGLTIELEQDRVADMLALDQDNTLFGYFTGYQDLPRQDLVMVYSAAYLYADYTGEICWSRPWGQDADDDGWSWAQSNLVMEYSYF